MATNRMMPPADGLHPAIIVNGRTYTCALGSTIDVPDFDSRLMQSNGWVSGGSVGATASRPANPKRGDVYLDTDLTLPVRYDGKVWRNSFTGASA